MIDHTTHKVWHTHRVQQTRSLTEGNPYTANKELLIIPDAVHTDLYDRKDIIPFDKITSFFHAYLA